MSEKRWTIFRRTHGPVRTALTAEPAHVLVRGPDTEEVEVMPVDQHQALLQALRAEVERFRRRARDDWETVAWLSARQPGDSLIADRESRATTLDEDADRLEALLEQHSGEGK